MARPNCHLCDQPATVHETLIYPGGAVERHYCRAHGGSLWGAALPRTRADRATEEDSPRRFDDLQRGESRGGR